MESTQPVKEQDIVNKINLKALQDTYIQDLGLNVGQKAVLISALGTFRKDSHPLVDFSATAAPQTRCEAPTTMTQVTDQYISELLTAIENDLMPGMLNTNKGVMITQPHVQSMVVTKTF